jgi:peptidoglycan/xylan/chitin deacetylase (PgdA/CDA1 family)
MNRSAAPGRKAIAKLAATLALLMLLTSCGAGPDGAPSASPTPVPSAAATPSSALTPSPTRAAAATPALTPVPSPGAAVTYTVQAGDTLYSIARRFVTTAEAIADANQLTDAGLIYVGQVLIIPGPALATTPVPGLGYAEVIRKVETDDRMVAFTFDAGADAGFTAQILDLLKAEGITVSFGIVGRWAEQNPELLLRIAREGHHIINHSYDHASFTGRSTNEAALSQAERWRELDLTEEAIKAVTGVSTKPYFRPPYGDCDDSVNADIYADGYLYNVMWTVDSLGWRGIPSAEIAQRCLSLAEPGAVYVFHVGSESQDAAALVDIIEGLQQLGYSIVSVPTLLASR